PILDELTGDGVAHLGVVDSNHDHGSAPRGAAAPEGGEGGARGGRVQGRDQAQGLGGGEVAVPHQSDSDSSYWAQWIASMRERHGVPQDSHTYCGTPSTGQSSARCRPTPVPATKSAVAMEVRTETRPARPATEAVVVQSTSRSPVTSAVSTATADCAVVLIPRSAAPIQNALVKMVMGQLSWGMASTSTTSAGAGWGVGSGTVTSTRTTPVARTSRMRSSIASRSTSRPSASWATSSRSPAV